MACPRERPRHFPFGDACLVAERLGRYGPKSTGTGGVELPQDDAEAIGYDLEAARLIVVKRERVPLNVKALGRSPQDMTVSISDFGR